MDDAPNNSAPPFESSSPWRSMLGLFLLAFGAAMPTLIITHFIFKGGLRNDVSFPVPIWVMPLTLPTGWLALYPLKNRPAAIRTWAVTLMILIALQIVGFVAFRIIRG
jgi:hypothetical protein